MGRAGSAGIGALELKTIYLIACGSKKHSERRMAKDLYTGGLFIAARNFVEATGQPWFILSGLHRLVEPDTLLDPYEFFLGKQTKQVRRQWSGEVARQIPHYSTPGDRIVILAGHDYWEFLEPLLTGAGYTVELPLQGRSIGKQLQWLVNNGAGSETIRKPPQIAKSKPIKRGKFQQHYLF